MIDALDRWLTEYEELYPAGGVVRVTVKNEVVFNSPVGFSCRETHTLMSSDNLFRFYSLTKPFTALCIMRLFDVGRLSLDEHPGKYIEIAGGLDKSLTVAHLLTHESGIYEFHADASCNRENLYKKVGEHLAAHPEHKFAPGTRSEYCNINFLLLSFIAEEQYCMDFESCLVKKVFNPLGMETAGIGRFDEKKNHVCGYKLCGREVVPIINGTADLMLGAGAAYGTASDVYRLNLAIKNKSLISKKAWKLVLSPAIDGFGFGCRVIPWHNKNRIIHNGGHIGFRTYHVQLPDDDVDIIILSNMGFGNFRTAFSEAAYQLVYKTYASPADKTVELDRGFVINSDIYGSVLHPQRPLPVSSPEAEMYAGVYTGDGKYNKLIKKGDEWQLVLSGGDVMYVYYIGNGEFQNEIIDERYKFTTDNAGQIRFLDTVKTL